MKNYFWSKADSQNYQLKYEGEQRTKEWLVNNREAYFKERLHKTIPQDWLNTFSIIPSNDADRQYYNQIFTSGKPIQISDLKLSREQLKGVGSILGMAIGDALGASTQFEHYDKSRQYWIKDDFQDLQRCIDQRILSARSGEMGIWTDDCSMGLSMGTGILLNNYEFDEITIRYMFILWLHHGLDNGGRSYSIGLGGNISMSMNEFLVKQTPYTQQGDQFTSGNGSLMRLATVPIAYMHNQKQAVFNSEKQSRTTHQGIQAYQCSKLLGLIIIRLAQRQQAQQQNWRSIIDKACADYCQFYSSGKDQSVSYLAQSKCETQQMFQQKLKNKGFQSANKSIEDRNWNWKDPNFSYSAYRAHRQPGYVGSYCMDALSMALHIVWSKNTFKEMVLWAINMGGDCDTVGSIVGQISGAIFGLNEQMLKLYSQMADYKSQRYQAFLIGMKLVTKRKAFQEFSIQQKNQKIETNSTIQNQKNQKQTIATNQQKQQKN